MYNDTFLQDSYSGKTAPNGLVLESGSKEIQLNYICHSLQSKKKDDGSAERVTGLCLGPSPTYDTATHLQNSSENVCFPGSAHKTN